jgi:hypothetical protein
VRTPFHRSQLYVLIFERSRGGGLLLPPEPGGRRGPEGRRDSDGGGRTPFRSDAGDNWSPGFLLVFRDGSERILARGQSPNGGGDAS